MGAGRRWWSGSWIASESPSRDPTVAKLATAGTDRIHGAMDQTKGIWKETSGKITGDRSTEVSGKLDQAKGKVEEKIGDTKAAVRRGDEPDR